MSYVNTSDPGSDSRIWIQYHMKSRAISPTSL